MNDKGLAEKQKLAELAREFYENRGLPDDRYFWAAARGAVQKILEDAKGPQPPTTLFLRLHYPFFDRDVQKVLMERHPEKQKKITVDSWHAVEAYLIAEQYALLHYSDDALKNLNLIEGAAQVYFVVDLPWFSRLLVAVAKAVEQLRGDVTESLTIVEKLQAWSNIFSHLDTTPVRWMAGTDYLENQKKFAKKPFNSVRVKASVENTKRKEIFQSWLMCWQAELDRLNALLGASLIA